MLPATSSTRALHRRFVITMAPYDVASDSNIRAALVCGMVLQRYESMLSRHVIITVFLTMLVGAGGNAGNQSAIKVIEGIAIGEVSIDLATFWKALSRELLVGLMLAGVVGAGGFLRAFATHGYRHGSEARPHRTCPFPPQLEAVRPPGNHLN